MTIATLLLLAQLPPIQPFVTELRQAISVGNQARVQALFQKPSETDYLFRMAAGRGGLRVLKVAVIPSPPGWEASGKYWAVIHTRQDIEDYHDPVYPIVAGGSRWRLGPEIPEDATTGAQIKDAALNVRLMPVQQMVQVHATVDLTISALNRAPLFRLNDNFHINSAKVGPNPSPAGSSGIHVSPNPELFEVGEAIPTPKNGDVVHAGSLLIPWTKAIGSRVEFDYSGTVNAANEDRIDGKVCYLTAWWVPSLGRLPHTTSTRVVGPAPWVLQSEGKRISADESKVAPAFKPSSSEQEACFRCDVPISYPKVVGGVYVVAAEQRKGDRIYRAYHFDDKDKARAEKDVKTIADAIAWYEEHLGPFPFNEYFCYDADTYYGIESYNYTLLRTSITSWAVGHEAGHTYFGGLVPCAYVHDSWNESMTQYVDSVLRQNNADQTLEGAYQSINLKVPLTSMPVAHEYNSATYMRGAFVLRMLENEIGLDNMYKAIRAVIADRVGKDTTWYDLRPYFEKTSGKKLDWFWRQWVSSAAFPVVKIVDAQGIRTPSGTRVHITVRQSGTAEPYRLRFKVIARGINKEISQVVEMRSPEASFELNLGNVKAYEAALDTFGYVLTPRIKATPVKL
jgi:hypothetical protein